ncbi:hypothetical protein [Phenylobacterium deserti]|uniref:Uncharacterized protein n=1 Tax=Phenylobacterium deserti TaxID=1914756 RepID=A0A328A8U6_9CAUL|nr:hypothetical protein [Phenylobacterium deserti]RAK50981.1 hypothetical protein DJ018_17645 [Phenylobacterium deserti]
MIRARAALFALAGALTALPALAQTGAPADGPIATASGGSPLASGRSTEAQIQQYLDSSPAAEAERAPLPLEGERRPHGEVSVAVGTGGYRSGYVRGDFPVGKSGQVSVAVGQSRGRGFYAPYGGVGYGGHPYGGFYDGGPRTTTNFGVAAEFSGRRTVAADDRSLSCRWRGDSAPPLDGSEQARQSCPSGDAREDAGG